MLSTIYLMLRSAHKARLEARTTSDAALILSFPRKQECRDFSRLPWAPAFAGGDDLAGRRHFFTPSFAGMTARSGSHTYRSKPMRAEIQAVADDIKKSLALLRRHL